MASLASQLADAHCHPQDDGENLAALASLGAQAVAVMGTREDDWEQVERALAAAPGKVIPCFGVHPWFAHLHGPPPPSTSGSSGSSGSRGGAPASCGSSSGGGKERGSATSGGAEDSSCSASLVTGSSGGGGGGGGGGGQQSSAAGGAAGAAGDRREGTGSGPGPGAAAAAAGAASPSCSMRSLLDIPPKQDEAALGALLALRPSCAWEPRLRGLLARHPRAVVGEFGLDRAAVVPGTKAQVRFEHQLALTQRHLEIAADMRRPVSMHCVRGYGHLHAMLKDMASGPKGADGVPPAIMLHSFGGSVEVVSQFVRGLPAGVGARLYFSFSAVINGRARAKLLDRIRAVPEDRLLLESDQNTPLRIDSGLEEIAHTVAEAKGWTVDRVVEVAMLNFRSFFGPCMPR